MLINKFFAALLCCAAIPVWAQNADKVYSTQSVQASEPAVNQSSDKAKTANKDKVWSTTELRDSEKKAIRNNFEKRFPGIKVTAVRITPMHGIYEIQVGLDLLYTDADVNYVLQGSLIDAHERRDLTAERLEIIQRVAFDSLPLENSIRQVKGDGSRVFAVFEDPNCGYCKQLHKTLESVDNVTVYSFLFPILTPDSHTKSRDIWCAKNPAKAWKDWMVNGVVPAKAESETPLETNLALGRKLNVQGTPALFFADGSRVNGALPLAALEKKLAEQSPKK